MKRKIVALACVFLFVLSLPAVPVLASDISLSYEGDLLDVYSLQYRLNELGYSVGAEDGSYGNATAAGVSQFQADHGLEVTGSVDQATWDALYDDYASTEYKDCTLRIKLLPGFAGITNEGDYNDIVLYLDNQKYKCGIFDVNLQGAIDDLCSIMEQWYSEDTGLSVEEGGLAIDMEEMTINGYDAVFLSYSHMVNVDGVPYDVYYCGGAISVDEERELAVEFFDAYMNPQGFTSLASLDLHKEVMRTAEITYAQDSAAAGSASGTETADSDAPYQAVEDGTNLMDLMPLIYQYVNPDADGTKKNDDGSYMFDLDTCVSMYYGCKIMKWYQSMIAAGNDEKNTLTEAGMQIIVNWMDQDLKEHYPEIRKQYLASISAAVLADTDAAKPYLEAMGITSTGWTTEELVNMYDAVMTGFDNILETASE